MKRYTADELHGNLYYMLPDDAEFYSRADLIAAGVLVPVPDGEMTLDSIEEECVFIDGDGDFGFASGGECWLRPNEVVTKVRLVKLEDLP